MKKFDFFCFVSVLMIVLFSGCSRDNGRQSVSSKENTEKTKAAFEPAMNVTWVVGASPGSNSDVFSRTVAEIIRNKGLCSKSIVIDNRTDGGGSIARRTVSQESGDNANHTLLLFNTGDLPLMLENTDIRIEDFRCIATLVRDKHIIYITKNAKIKSFPEFVETLRRGEKVVIGGSTGDDNMFYNLLKRYVDPGDNLSYLQYLSTNDVAVAALGGHCEIAIGKPAVCTPYVVNGDFIPIAIEGDTRSAAPFQDAPTLKELGFAEVSFIQNRSIVGSKKMSGEAVEYWEKIFKEVSESEEIKTNYTDKYLSELGYMNGADTTTYYTTAQKNTLESLGK